MNNMPIWEVTLFVEGAITVKENIALNEPKGFHIDDPFYSDIQLKRNPYGVEATVTAFAPTTDVARKAALLFFGQMLDALAIQINESLYLSLYKSTNRRENLDKRRVTREEWQAAFKEARHLAFTETTFLRSLSWYRKGLYTDDPFDKFLAFWNSIEIVAVKYAVIPEGKPKGSISKIWESFKAIWGECENWPIISGDANWIDVNNKIRNEIAHGVAPVQIEEVEVIIDKLDKLHRVAYKFLTDWRARQLYPHIAR